MRRIDLPEGEHVLAVDEAYDRWAAVYDSDGNPLTLLEEPEIHRLMGEVTNLDVADIGCGTGRHTSWLAESGARVTALDLSEGMMEQARKKLDSRHCVSFVHHDLEHPFPLQDQSFDCVLSGLVLEHIVDLKSFFRELRRICRYDGFVLLSAMHPAMMLKGIQAGFHDPETDEKIHPKSLPNQISDFLSAAIDAGLELDSIVERFVDEELAARAPRAEKHLGWPLLLVMRFRPIENLR